MTTQPPAEGMGSATFGDNNEGFQAHTVNGPVHNEFNNFAPPERPETPPDPSIVIPFSRDQDFIERDTLTELAGKCAQPGSRTALVGLGGVGKSQLAIEFAYRTRDQSPDTWVLWVHASNAARFTQSYQEIANYARLPGRRDPKTNILQLVHDWLRDKRRRWVLILDNVDDAGFLFEKDGAQEKLNTLESIDAQSLVSYIPQCQNGSVLVTTRTEIALRKLVEPRDIMFVKPMNKYDACTLLEKKLGKQDDSASADELTAALEFMPLAIVQAAAYIYQRAPRYSVQQYLEEFRRSDRDKESLLNFAGGRLRRDRDAKDSVITTWQISFDHVRRIRPSAADLLSLMSFFDRQGIPEGLLRTRNDGKKLHKAQQKRDSRSIRHLTRLFLRKSNLHEGKKKDIEYEAAADGFEDDVLLLRDFTFISVEETRTSFEMHILVQLAMRAWLDAHG